VARIKTIFATLLLLSASRAPAVAADGPRWPNLPGGDPSSPQISGAQQKGVNVYEAPPPVSAITGEMGLRYWYSWGSTAKDLFNTTGAFPVSRLTYGDLQGHALEGVARFDHTHGFYVKGYLGGALLLSGNLNDEDFPPVITPYSSTDSSQKEGTLLYGSADLGFNFFRQPGFRLGAFGGYHYFNQRVIANGCSQIASNASVCGTFPVPDSVRVILQENQFHSLRVGLDADIKLGQRWLLRTDAAWLPYVKLNGVDDHLLRVGSSPGDFTGGIPEDGRGWGYQLEGSLSYAVSNDISIALGARYWHMETKGHAHFEGHVVGITAFPQPVHWKTDIVGVFVQGSFKLGPYGAGAHF
jgi:hypothetical protein